jgi:Holliday junction DNA helicase RuvA
MIGRLRGKVVERALDGTCVVEVGGVGYEVTVPVGALGQLAAAEIDKELTLYVHTHVREDQLALYGFLTGEDRDAFRALLGVQQVGPRVALGILSALDAHALAQAVAAEDRKALKGIPGVGPKTVERILLDLKDKLPWSASSTGSVAASAVRGGSAAASGRGVGPARAVANGPLALVTSALVQLGYKPAEADRAVARLLERGADTEGKPPELLLREALALLG